MICFFFEGAFFNFELWVKRSCHGVFMQCMSPDLDLKVVAMSLKEWKKEGGIMTIDVSMAMNCFKKKTCWFLFQV